MKRQWHFSFSVFTVGPGKHRKDVDAEMPLMIIAKVSS